MSPAASHIRQPIEGLPDPAALASPDVRAFTNMWQRQRARMQAFNVLATFQERLARKWSIETGVLERLYDLSRGLTVTLIEQGFHASLVSHKDATMSGDRLVEILEDHRQGLALVMDLIGQTRPFSVGWIKDLHALLTRHQQYTDGITTAGQHIQLPLLRGAYKQHSNNPTRPDGTVHEYCPPEHVAAEMDRLIEVYHELPETLPEVRAAWLHHRFTQIHPFQDGNGRVARALASFEFIRAGLLPLLVDRDDRDRRYLPALEAADQGDLRPLVTFFADCMSRVLLQASAEAEAVTSRKADLAAVLRAGRRKVEARNSQTREGSSNRIAVLAGSLRRQFDALCAQIQREVPETRANVFVPAADQTHWFRSQLVALARRNNYWLDFSAPRTWIRLRLQTASAQTDIVASLHRLSGAVGGGWVMDAFLQHGDPKRSEGDQPELVFLDIDPLLLSFEEPEATQLARVETWIVDHLSIVATAQWIHFL